MDAGGKGSRVSRVSEWEAGPCLAVLVTKMKLSKPFLPRRACQECTKPMIWACLEAKHRLLHRNSQGHPDFESATPWVCRLAASDHSARMETIDS